MQKRFNVVVAGWRQRLQRSTTHRCHEARSSDTARGAPIVRVRNARSTSAAIAARAPISAEGSSPPSTATLMKRYDAPQSAARTRIKGQYRFTRPRYRRPLVAPVASAVPPRISVSPASADAVTGSSRTSQPFTSANAGTRYVTRIAREAPARTMSAK